jgi:hypothetical protein
MSEIQQQARKAEPQFAAPSLSDVSSLAEAVLAQALEFCAQKMGLSTRQAAIHLLRQGDTSACQYWRFGLARQVAQHLGAWDEDVKAVYTCDYDATPQDLCFSEAGPASLVHLIVWAQRKTAALNALADSMDSALVECCAEELDAPNLAHLLDVQVIDDADVKNRLGYGAMLSSLHNRPIQVWQR